MFGGGKISQIKYLHKGAKTMTSDERELITLINESVDPEKVRNYMLNLFLDYLRTHAPSQDTPVVAPRVSI